MPTFRLLVALLFFLPQPVLRGAEPVLDADQVTVTELPEQDQYYIHGVFEVDADAEQVWKVLSDYAGLQGVISSLRSSKVVGHDADGMLVEQVMDGQFLFFHKGVRLLLRVKEQAPWRIDFTQAEDKPFRHYQGAWQIEPVANGCRVDYTLTVSRGDMAPLFLERRLFRENSLDLMRELKAAVQRRASQAPLAVATRPEAAPSVSHQ
jgi:ribosome-associated toxin RatA of RatAB toxin-antitoxin module